MYDANVRNYNLFYDKRFSLLFSYFEYIGECPLYKSNVRKSVLHGIIIPVNSTDLSSTLLISDLK